MMRSVELRRVCMVLICACAVLLTGGAYAAVEEPKVLTVLVHDFAPWVEATAEDLLRSNPGVKVEVSKQSVLVDKLNTLFAAGTPPELVLSNMANRHEWFTKGLFADLAPYIARDKFDTKALLPPAVDALRYGNRQPGLPNDIAVMGFFYSVDDYEEAGAVSPADLYQARNWGIPTFLEGVRKTTVDREGDGKIDRYGYSANISYDGWVRHFLAVFDGGLVSDDDQKILFDSPQSQAAIEYIVSLNREYQVARMGAPQNDIASGISSAGHHFQDTPFRMSTMQKRDFRLGATVPVLLTPQSQLRSVMIVNHWSIPTGSKYPDLAWEFIKLLLSDKHQKTMPGMVALWPARLSAMREMVSGMQNHLATNAGFMMDIVNNAEMTPFRSFPGYLRNTPGGIARAMTDALRSAWDGKESVSTATTRAAEVMRGILKQALLN
jgi:ABC-type glycerol-3-phosphate transport system substrate-binding protein